MDHDDRVLPRLDDFVEIADGAVSCGRRERPVDPDGLVAPNQEASGEIARREIVMAGDRHERASSFSAMCSMNRVLPHPVGPLSITGSPRA